MAQLPGTFVRQFLGQPVRVALTGGPVLEGHLVSFDGRSLWLVTEGEDRFVPMAHVEMVVPSPVTPPPVPPIPLGR